MRLAVLVMFSSITVCASNVFAQVNGSVSITAGQGFSRSLTTNAAVATVTNAVPGFVFGGSVVPFVTALTPVVSMSPQANRPAGESRIQRMLSRGDIQVRKDRSGTTRLLFNETPEQAVWAHAKSQPDPPPNSASLNSFRRGIEK